MHRRAGDPGEERYEVLGVGAGGRVAFRKPVAAPAHTGALSPSHQMLLAWTATDDEKTGHPECGLSALDAATGETLWEKVVPFPDRNSRPAWVATPIRFREYAETLFVARIPTGHSL